MLKDSWSAFPREIAKIYLDGYGHPSERSKHLMVTLLKERFGGRPFRLADFGCGNGHLLGFFQDHALDCEYYGYDFSVSLLAAAHERYKNNPYVRFSEVDIEDPFLSIPECDIVLYSHVLEILQSPQRSLVAARRCAPAVMIRFFEPPLEEYDITEMRMMDTGGGRQVPYLRRKMSKDYYNLILNSIGCRAVEIHQVDSDKDEIHILKFSD